MCYTPVNFETGENEMQIKHLWIVTKPTKDSDFYDICFKSDMRSLNMQFLGGLSYKEIVGVFTNEGEAARLADDLLRERDCDLENEYIQ